MCIRDRSTQSTGCNFQMEEERESEVLAVFAAALAVTAASWWWLRRRPSVQARMDARPPASPAAGTCPPPIGCQPSPSTCAAPSSNTANSLPDEVWVRVLHYLSAENLCRATMVCRCLSSLGSSDGLWRPLCLERWASKQRMHNTLFWRANYGALLLSPDECRAIMLGRGIDPSNLDGEREVVMGMTELRAAVQATSPAGTRLVLPCKWKASYVYAEMDSTRVRISKEEVAYFRWGFLYHGQPSRSGVLRKFQLDGSFVSPYFGASTWHLTPEGQFVVASHEPLSVSREPDWSWVMGKGTSTQYVSVDPLEPEVNSVLQI
eukprot:TRINITY_DN60053_c0_g1_i1.p1 TRINITY_DN60053_c0_g1~~TRINITY_DN60053_c0_g1_i1.p1  ORF type:complete len:320 (+),score=58.45 TRINITY_DN60053_c0_g1_i1:183-1142(+)